MCIFQITDILKSFYRMICSLYQLEQNLWWIPNLSYFLLFFSSLLKIEGRRKGEWSSKNGLNFFQNSFWIDQICVTKTIKEITADTDLLKMVHVEILLNFKNHFRTLQLGFWKFLSIIGFLHYYISTN